MAERECGNFIVSFSEIKTFHECGHRHLKLYKEGLNKELEFNPTKVYNGWGSSFHDTVELLLNGEISENEAELFFKDQMWKNLGKILLGPALKQSEIEMYLDSYEKSFSVIKQLPKWLSKEFGNYKILGTEVKYEIPISSLNEILPPENRSKNKIAYESTFIKGFIDCMLMDEKGNIHIIDWKTSYKGWNSYKRKDKVMQHQLIVYKAVILAGMHLSSDVSPFTFKDDSDRSSIKKLSKDISTSFVIVRPVEEKDKPLELLSVPSNTDSLIHTVKWITDAVISMKKGIHFHNSNACMFCEIKNHPEHCRHAIDF